MNSWLKNGGIDVVKLPQYDIETITKLKKSRDYPSVVFLTCGVSDILIQSLRSILDNTTIPFELIIVAQGVPFEVASQVDNALKGNTDLIVNFKSVNFPFNQGFIVGMNEGLRLCRGKWLVPFSDDIIVSKGWLKALVDKAKSDKKIGIVGFKAATRPSYLIQLQNGMWKTDNSIMISMICSLITRGLYQKIGGFDYRYGKGICEDDDYNVMARMKGFKLAEVDVPIQHVHSSSWKRLMSHEERMKRVAININVFNQKWKEFNIVRI